jgi:hypothetical protein
MFAFSTYRETGVRCLALRLLWQFRFTFTAVQMDTSVYIEVGFYIHTLGIKFGIGNFKV